MGSALRSLTTKTLRAMSGLMLLLAVPMIGLFILLWARLKEVESSRRLEDPVRMSLFLASLFVPILWLLLILGVVIPLQARRPAWTGTAILTVLVTLLGVAPVFPLGNVLDIHDSYSIDHVTNHLIDDLVPLFDLLRNGTHGDYTKYRIMRTINQPATEEALNFSMAGGLAGLGAVMWMANRITFIVLIIVSLMNIGTCLLERQPGEPGQPRSLGMTVGGRHYYIKWGREGEIALPMTSEDVATPPAASSTAA